MEQNRTPERHSCKNHFEKYFKAFLRLHNISLPRERIDIKVEPTKRVSKTIDE